MSNSFVIPWSPPGSSVHGISQVRVLEWVVISFSRGSSWPRDQTPVSCIDPSPGGFSTTEPPGKQCYYIYIYIFNVDIAFAVFPRSVLDRDVWLWSLACVLSQVQLIATLWTVAWQPPLSLEFPRQKYQSGLLFPPPGDRTNSKSMSPTSLHWQADSLPLSHLGSPVSLWWRWNNLPSIFPRGSISRGGEMACPLCPKDRDVSRVRIWRKQEESFSQLIVILWQLFTKGFTCVRQCDKLSAQILK